MSCIFKGCKEIKYLPDISEWDTSNTTTFKFLFRKCFNLNKLPDIGKWNVTKARNLSYLFSDFLSIVLYQKYQNGIFLMLKILAICFLIVKT